MRKSGTEVWEFRFRNHAEPGNPMRQITLSTTQYATETKARVALQEKLLRINGPDAYLSKQEPTFGLVIDRFIKDERVQDILAQKPGETTITGGISYATAAGYRSYLIRHIKPRWNTVLLHELQPIEIKDWLQRLPLAPKTQGHVRGLMHLLFERAMLWGMIDVDRNIIELVHLRGGSRRLRRPLVLTPEQYQNLMWRLEEPHRTMAAVAMCTGLRASEILALRWEDINFESGVVLVQRGVVNGRIGQVKTEASADDIPLAQEFSKILLDWKSKTPQKNGGLVFQSPVTGGCYYAGIIQQGYLRPVGEKMGLRGLGWHTFRHTYRSLLDETGAPIGVQQKLMRHANVSTTMNIYGSAALAAKKAANSKVVQMVLPSTAQKKEAV